MEQTCQSVTLDHISFSETVPFQRMYEQRPSYLRTLGDDSLALQ